MRRILIGTIQTATVEDTNTLEYIRPTTRVVREELGYKVA